MVRSHCLTWATAISDRSKLHGWAGEQGRDARFRFDVSELVVRMLSTLSLRNTQRSGHGGLVLGWDSSLTRWVFHESTAAWGQARGND